MSAEWCELFLLKMLLPLHLLEGKRLIHLIRPSYTGEALHDDVD